MMLVLWQLLGASLLLAGTLAFQPTGTTARPVPIRTRRSHHSFQTPPPRQSFGMTASSGDTFFDMQGLQDRLHQMRVDMLEDDLRRPPNPQLTAQEFVTEILHGLLENAHPLPDSGFRTLLQASTIPWRQSLHDSVGAPMTANQEVVAAALGQAMGRPNNQFAILVGESNNDDDDDGYEMTFESDPLDYADGTAWLECRLRKKSDHTLLVATGWQLKQRRSDGAWLVDAIDWQDFREDFRPGIGREEWMRICG